MANILEYAVTPVVSKLLKSNDINDEHKENISSVFLTVEVLILKSIDNNEVQFLNIHLRLLRFEVSKWLKSNDEIEIQFWNIPSMFITLEVLKWLKSIDDNALQAWNKQPISLALETSKLIKFIDNNEEQL